MRRSFGLLGLLVVLSLALPAGAESAKSLHKKGKDAEARQNYEAAYEFFRQAYEKKPKDVRYRASYERMRFLGALAHVHRGQQLREEGKLEEALAAFRKAISIDPALFIAQQEARRTETMIEAAKGGAPATPPQSGLQKRIQNAGGPVELNPISDVPITLNMTEDSKVIYQTVGKLAGINVLFDPDYTSRRIRIELNGVTLNDALQIIALQSKTFWRPVTPNTIFVAADNPTKRKELEQSVVRTFYLSNVSAPTDLQDVVNTIRTLLDLARVTQLQSQSAIVVRGTPDQVALAEKLIGDIDKAKPEVVVEVAIMQVSRDRLRRLGISPPTSTSIALQPATTTTSTGTSGTANPTTTTTTQNTLTLNKLGSLSANDFVVTIPAATANFLATDSNTKIIQNPQIRALDGQKASLKIGDRVPVATGSFQPGIGGVGINPLVNTQFNYIDVGVNIDITPRIHAGREVTLKMVLDVSSVTSRVNIGGIDQPVIGQRKIEHEIRLKEGEVNMLGGILEQQESRSIAGLPFVSQVPLLRYLFSSEEKNVRDNEIVFLLIPRVVRAQEVSEMNVRALDVGTANTIDLRRGSRPAPAPGQGPTPQPQAAPGGRAAQAVPRPTQLPTQPAPTQPTPAPPQPAQPAPITPPQTAGAPQLMLEAPAAPVAVGASFAVNVAIANAGNVHSVPVQITYDPRLMQLVNVSNGEFLSQDGQAVALVHRPDEATGTVQLTGTRPPGTQGVAGNGTVYTLTFVAKAAGQAGVAITRAVLRDAGMHPTNVSGSQAVVTIR
jgi:general secretion pathway protein D